jgi:hypothetical protein
MSWIEKVKSDFIITTGDGKEYRPLWIRATKTLEYNIAEFEFPNLPGTLVKKSTPKGRKYSLEIYFQGEDNLDVSEAFQTSADDSRPWTIIHPLYGNLTVQPLGLDVDNSGYNVSKISGTVLETITDENPVTKIDPLDNLLLNKENSDALFVASFTETPSVTDSNAMISNNQKLYKEGSKLPMVPEEVESYFNAFNTANSAVLKVTSVPLLAIRTTIAFISAPALFTSSVRSRVGLLSAQFAILRIGLSTSMTRASKKIYEVTAGSLITSQAVASARPIAGDYGNRNGVVETMEIIVGNYNSYIADLDLLQSANGGEPDSYIPDASSLIELNNLVNFTVSSLFDIASKSRQERTIYMEDDTNIILLTHRLYSLDPDDANIAEMMGNNNIGLNEILLLRKGRKIIYYI